MALAKAGGLSLLRGTVGTVCVSVSIDSAFTTWRGGDNDPSSCLLTAGWEAQTQSSDSQGSACRGARGRECQATRVMPFPPVGFPRQLCLALKDRDGRIIHRTGSNL